MASNVLKPPPKEPQSTGNSAPENPMNPDLIDWRYKINNDRLFRITKTKTIESFYETQQSKWIAHVIRRENNDIIKILTFHTTKGKRGAPVKSILERSINYSRLDRNQFIRDCFNR